MAFVLVWPMVFLHAGVPGGIGNEQLAAPRAGLMAQLATGIVGGNMPWALILIGIAFGLSLVLIKSPSPMLIAVGMYLHLDTTAAIFLGGVLACGCRWRAAPVLTDQRQPFGTGDRVQRLVK